MNRREFITLAGGAAAAWPVVARAQQPGGMRRIGWMDSFREDDTNAQARAKAFRESLRDLDGGSVEISQSTFDGVSLTSRGLNERARNF